MNRHQLVCRKGGRACSVLGWRLGLSGKRYRTDDQENADSKSHYALDGAAAWAVRCFTAISMNASAARLRALSLRNTKARSRRICASEIGMAANTPACTSSATCDSAMNPTPTSAATKRLSSSLESSSIEYCGLSFLSSN